MAASPVRNIAEINACGVEHRYNCFDAGSCLWTVFVDFSYRDIITTCTLCLLNGDLPADVYSMNDDKKLYNAVK